MAQSTRQDTFHDDEPCPSQLTLFASCDLQQEESEARFSSCAIASLGKRVPS